MPIIELHGITSVRKSPRTCIPPGSLYIPNLAARRLTGPSNATDTTAPSTVSATRSTGPLVRRKIVNTNPGISNSRAVANIALCYPRRIEVESFATFGMAPITSCLSDSPPRHESQPAAPSYSRLPSLGWCCSLPVRPCPSASCSRRAALSGTRDGPISWPPPHVGEALDDM